MTRPGGDKPRSKSTRHKRRSKNDAKKRRDIQKRIERREGDAK